MLTLTLQCVSALLLLAFGGVALSISRWIGVLTPDRRAGWLVTGLGFALLGVSAAAQNAVAVAAFASGEGTAAYDAYLRWAPALNHSRVFAGTALALVLAATAWSGRLPARRFRTATAAGVLAAMLLGGVAGWMEGGFEMQRHGAATAVGYTIEMLAFATVLLASASRGTFDLFLFAALMLYALKIAVGVPLWSGMSLAEAVAGPAPAPWLLQVQSVLFGAVMLAVAALRLALLRRGVRVAEVFGEERVVRVRFFEGEGA